MSAASLYAAESGPNINIPIGGTLRGHFIDDHVFKDGATSARFEGHFLVAPDYGVIWYVEKPLPLTVTVTSAGLTQKIGNMRLPSITAAHMPILSRTTQLLSDALMGKWENLEKDFTVTHHATQTGWQATLTPKPAVGINVKTITVEGKQFVNTANATRSDGGTDSFAFSNQNVSATPPTDVEVNNFNDANAPH